MHLKCRPLYLGLNVLNNFLPGHRLEPQMARVFIIRVVGDVNQTCAFVDSVWGPDNSTNTGHHDVGMADGYLGLRSEKSNRRIDDIKYDIYIASLIEFYFIFPFRIAFQFV